MFREVRAKEHRPPQQAVVLLTDSIGRRSIVTLDYDLGRVPTSEFEQSPAERGGQQHLCAYLRLNIQVWTSVRISVSFKGRELCVEEVDR